MIDDHTGISAALKGLTTSGKAQANAPSSLDKAHQDKLDKLSNLPAGHRGIVASDDLLVIGANPASGDYDEPKADEISLGRLALRRIAKVRRPTALS